MIIYLDQNIISLIANKEISLSTHNKNTFVYSNEHFNEISRSNNPKKYLEALESINAKQIIQQVDSDFNIIDSFYLDLNNSAQENYAEHIDTLLECNIDVSSFDYLVALLNHGKVTIEEVEAAQSISDQSLINHLESLGIKGKKEVILKATGDAIKALKPYFSETQNIEKVRNDFDIPRGFMSNLNPESALDNIWECIKHHYENTGINKNQFYGFEPYPWQSAKHNVTASIHGCCAILDIIGYASESKCRNINKVPNIRSDAQHIAMATVCDVILSCDEKIITRAQAIYSFLRKPVKTKLISINKK